MGKGYNYYILFELVILQDKWHFIKIIYTIAYFLMRHIYIIKSLKYSAIRIFNNLKVVWGFWYSVQIFLFRLIHTRSIETRRWSMYLNHPLKDIMISPTKLCSRQFETTKEINAWIGWDRKMRKEINLCWKLMMADAVYTIYFQ